MLVAISLLAACSDSVSSSLRLNELLAASDPPDEDWVELYNPTDSEISLAGYELRDDNNFWTFSEGSIPAGGFLQVICDGSGQNGKASFKLSSSGEVASIHDANGDPLDRVVFPALGIQTSYGRIPDGDGDWTILGTPSPGQPNIAGAPPDGGLIPDSSVTPDSGTSKPDYGSSKPDYGSTKPDYGSSKVDQGMTEDAVAADGVAGD